MHNHIDIKRFRSFHTRIHRFGFHQAAHITSDQQKI
jgi:hypothetical protein